MYAGIEAVDLVPGLAPNRHAHRAGTGAITREQNPHVPTHESLEEMSARGFRPPATIMIRDLPRLIHCTNRLWASRETSIGRVNVALGDVMEEAGDDRDPPVSQTQDPVDRALSDAARRADSVPAAVVDAAKAAYDQRGCVTGADASADDETAEPAAAPAAPGTHGATTSVGR